MNTTAPARVWTFGRVGALVLAILTLIAGLALVSNRAMAAFVSIAENGIVGHLSLRADPYPTTLNPDFMSLTPGDSVHWQIETSLVDASSPLTMQFKRDGALVERPGIDGLQVRAQLCAQAWTNFPTAPTCGTGATDIIPTTPANSATFGPLAANSDPVPGTAPVYNLGTLTNTADKFVLVTLSLPAQADPEAQSDTTLMGLEASFGFGFTAMGDDPPANLPNTGLDLTALLVAGLGVLGLGLVLASARRARLGFDEGSRS
jgi:LPXTG-motif cell wall-anchored protein